MSGLSFFILRMIKCTLSSCHFIQSTQTKRTRWLSAKRKRDLLSTNVPVLLKKKHTESELFQLQSMEEELSFSKITGDVKMTNAVVHHSSSQTDNLSKTFKMPNWDYFIKWNILLRTSPGSGQSYIVQTFTSIIHRTYDSALSSSTCNIY